MLLLSPLRDPLAHSESMTPKFLPISPHRTWASVHCVSCGHYSLPHPCSLLPTLTPGTLMCDMLIVCPERCSNDPLRVAAGHTAQCTGALHTVYSCSWHLAAPFTKFIILYLFVHLCDPLMVGILS